MAVLRKLGYWEIICKFAHQFYAGTGNLVTIAAIEGGLDTALIELALQQLYQRHPLLQVSLQEKQHEYYFVTNVLFSTVPRDYLTDKNNVAYQDIIETELNTPFPVADYLWRITILCAEKNYIILTTHHSIADGLSTVNFIQDLLKCYSELQADVNYQLERLSALASVEALLKEKKSWDKFIQAKERHQDTTIAALDFNGFAKLSKRKTKIIQQVLNENVLQQLQKNCRQQQTTLNAALNAAMLFTLRQMDKDVQATTLHTPVNLRPYCKPQLSAAHLGCYITMVTTAHHGLQDAALFWQVARNYRKQLQDLIPELGFCPADFSVADFDIHEITQIFEMASNTKRKAFTSGLGVTNLGRLDCPLMYGDVTLKSLNFCTNRNRGDFKIFLHALTFNNKLHLSFSYVEPLVDAEWAQQFVSKFLTILQDV